MKTTREIFKNSVKSGIFFFTGAGISFSPPSNLPLGNQVIDLILQTLLSKSHLGNDISVNEYILWISRKIPMELLWEILVRVVGKRILEILCLFEGDQPNADHIAISLICEKFNINTIFTLNFDSLQEKAIRIFTSKKALSVSTIRDFKRYISNSKKNTDSIWVIHLHNLVKPGNFRDLAITINDVGIGLPRYKSLALISNINEKDVICAGYSNGDIDTFPILNKTNKLLLWYLHEGTIPESVLQCKRKLKDKFILIKRNKDENGFSDLLSNIEPSIKLLLKSVKTSPPANHSNLDYMFQIQKGIEQYLGKGEDEIKNASSLILAILCDELGNRKLAKNIITSIDFNNEKRLVIKYALKMLEGHLNERLGNVIIAKKCFHYARENAYSKIKLQESEIELASANLGLWKRKPWKLLCLLKWYLIIRKLDHSNYPGIKMRAFWEKGDFNQHIADYLIFPSSRIISLHRKSLSKTLMKILSNLDKISILIFNGLRRYLFRLSANYYKDILRISRSNLTEIYPNYFSLALIRLPEVLAGSGNIQQAKKALRVVEKGENFYRWIQSEHGQANVLCAKGIYYFYSKNLKKSKILLNQAKKKYGSHLSGIIKTEIYNYRIENWY